MQNDLIYDLGFHTGEDTEFYLKKGFRVIAIEANPVLFEEGKKKFRAYINLGQLILINLGIGFESTILQFYINNTNSAWSSFSEELGTTRGDYKIVHKQVVPLEYIINKFGIPYYLKIDIEGFDHYVVDSIKKFKQKPQYISIENSTSYIIEELHKQGYQKFKLINQAEVHKISLKSPAKEGKEIKHQFCFGSSGPFGEETEGEWLNKEQVINLSDNYWNNPQRDANIHGWYDLHVTF